MPSRSDCDDQREEEDDTDRFIQPIHPELRTPADPRDTENDQDQQAADAKGAFYMDQLPHPAQQHPGKKWIEQPRESDIQLRGVERPAADQVPLRAPDRILHQQTSRQKDEDPKPPFRESPD